MTIYPVRKRVGSRKAQAEATDMCAWKKKVQFTGTKMCHLITSSKLVLTSHFIKAKKENNLNVFYFFIVKCFIWSIFRWLVYPWDWPNTQVRVGWVMLIMVMVVMVATVDMEDMGGMEATTMEDMAMGWCCSLTKPTNLTSPTKPTSLTSTAQPRGWLWPWEGVTWAPGHRAATCQLDLGLLKVDICQVRLKTS